MPTRSCTTYVSKKLTRHVARKTNHHFSTSAKKWAAMCFYPKQNSILCCVASVNTFRFPSFPVDLICLFSWPGASLFIIFGVRTPCHNHLSTTATGDSSGRGDPTVTHALGMHNAISKKQIDMFILPVGRQFSFWNGPFSRDMLFFAGGINYNLPSGAFGNVTSHKKPVGIRWYQANEPLVLVGVWVI